MQLDELLKRAGWRQKDDRWRSSSSTYRVHAEAVPVSWERSVAPFLAKAILHARQLTAPGIESIAALELKRATPLIDRRLADFVGEVAPGQAWILYDRDGRVFPHVASAPELKTVAEVPRLTVQPAERRHTSLFSDLNQWLLKVLLAPALPERLLTAPRLPLRNATALAAVAKVSPAGAARFVDALESEDQLDRRFGDLRVARPLELLKRWRDRLADARSHPSRRDVGAVSVRGPFDLRLLAMSARAFEAPGLVLRLHTACAELGLGHVQGATPAAWVSALEPRVLEPLGLVIADDRERVDVMLCVPTYPESAWRGAVRSGAPTSDVIQCWLDMSHHRLRGEEQADFLWRRVLEPAFRS